MRAITNKAKRTREKNKQAKKAQPERQSANEGGEHDVEGEDDGNKESSEKKDEGSNDNPV